MDGLENRLILDSNRCKIVDIEKPAIVDFICRDAPISKPIPLLLEQFFQVIKTFWFTGFAVQLLDRTVDCGSHVGRLLEQPGDSLLSISLCHGFRISLRTRWQIAQLRDNA